MTLAKDASLDARRQGGVCQTMVRRKIENSVTALGVATRNQGARASDKECLSRLLNSQLSGGRETCTKLEDSCCCLLCSYLFPHDVGTRGHEVSSVAPERQVVQHADDEEYAAEDAAWSRRGQGGLARRSSGQGSLRLNTYLNQKYLVKGALKVDDHGDDHLQGGGCRGGKTVEEMAPSASFFRPSRNPDSPGAPEGTLQQPLGKRSQARKVKLVLAWKQLSPPMD